MMKTILTQAGTTLFHIAATYLGDATQWFRLALVNNIQDPYLRTTTTLTIPPRVSEQNGRNDGRL